MPIYWETLGQQCWEVLCWRSAFFQTPQALSLSQDWGLEKPQVRSGVGETRRILIKETDCAHVKGTNLCTSRVFCLLWSYLSELVDIYRIKPGLVKKSPVYGEGSNSGWNDRKGCNFLLRVPEFGISGVPSVRGIRFSLLCCSRKEEKAMLQT